MFSVPRIKQVFAPGPISICGFGPSLRDTWPEISGDVMTTSGAHDFLIERGLVPKFHVETDPREHKVNFVRKSHPDVVYLINSQCHRTMFETLLDAGRTVWMWHGFTDDDVSAQVKLLESLEPGTRLMAGGTNAGMRSIIVARELGFTRFELHGMDCCYRGKTQWAGNHHTEAHTTVKIEVEGREFETSPMMMQSTDDFLNQMMMLAGCSFKIYGDGLLEARMQMFLRDKTRASSRGWWKPVNFALKSAYQPSAQGWRRAA